MDTITPVKKPRGGMNVWYALSTALVIVVLAVGGLVGYIVYQNRANAKLNREKEALQRQVEERNAAITKSQIDRSKAEEDTHLALAKNKQEEVLAAIRTSESRLQTLLSETKEAKGDVLALKTNEEGRQIARHPSLIPGARRFFETDVQALVSEDEIIAKIENQRRSALQIQKASGTLYEPDPKVIGSAGADLSWAAERIERITALRTSLDALISESKIKVAQTTNAPKSLEIAIKEAEEAEAAKKTKLIAEKLAEAKTESAESIAEAIKQKAIADGKKEAERLIAEAQKLKDEAQQALNIRKAEAKVAETKSLIEEQRLQAEARKAVLREKIKDPKIQAKLAPFTTPGFAQIGGVGFDKKPLSFRAIQTRGALNPTEAGLQALVHIAFTRNDRDRPRWNFHYNNEKGWTKRSEERAMVVETQQLLAELGPVLVEEGLLQP